MQNRFLQQIHTILNSNMNSDQIEVGKIRTKLTSKAITRDNWKKDWLTK